MIPCRRARSSTTAPERPRLRANLDAVEHLLAPLAVPAADHALLAEVVMVVTRSVRLHRLGVHAESVDRLPRRLNGKIDYCALSD